MSAADGSVPLPDWPTADSAEALTLRRAARAVAVADLFLPVEGRLRDDDRATVARLLATLVDRIEQALRRQLAVGLADCAGPGETLANPRIAIAAPILERAGALRDPALVATLLRRAAEARLVDRLRRARDRAQAIEPAMQIAPTALLADDPAPAVAAAARLLADTGGAARDAAGAALATACELAAEDQHRLAWRIAAALREYLTGIHALPPARVDPAIATAVEAVLAGYDEAATPAGRALGLARALAAAGRLDGSLAADALAAGEAMLAAATLAVRAGIGFGVSWDMMTDADPARPLLLCRAAGLPPAIAADIALRLASGEADDRLAERLEAYSALSPDRALAAIDLWRRDPAYRDSIAAIGVVERRR